MNPLIEYIDEPYSYNKGKGHMLPSAKKKGGTSAAKMPVSNRVKEQIGLGRVSWIVTTEWMSGWQPYTATNDDGIDGVILLRKGVAPEVDTGAIVFVQVKCGGDGYRKDQKQYPDHVGVFLKKEHIDNHKVRWQRAPGPMVLVFVDDTIDKKCPPAWWVDLRDPRAYSPTNGGMILIPIKQRFGGHTKGDFLKLCGSVPQDRLLERFKLHRKDSVIPILGRNENLRNDAWAFYKEWRGNLVARTNAVLGAVLVNRVGWKHITRRERLPERVLQSWLLLGAAKKMIQCCTDFDRLGHATVTTFDDGNTHIEDYLGLRAIVAFPHRHESVVQVVLKRSRLIAPADSTKEREKIWFYSVYERRRGSHQTI